MLKTLSISAIFVSLLIFSAFNANAADQRPYTIDDHLALEALGAGAAGGDRIIWQQAPAYDEIGYYGHEHIGAWGNTGFALQYLDLSAHQVAAKPLFEPEPGAT